MSIALVVFTGLAAGLGVQLSGTALAVSVSQTITVPLFGPQQFARSTGRPVAVTQSFSVPPSVHAPFFLVVDNGDTAGGDRVLSAHILLNGAEVAGPSDFNQQVVHFDREVAVNASDTLTVQLEGTPGSYLTISLTGTSDTVGALGGLITVTDPSSPIDGATVQIPAGALTQETSITLGPLSLGDLQTALGRTLPSGMRLAGGLIIDAGGSTFQKPAAVSLPNTLGLSSGDQLLVGRLDPTRPAPANLIYQGLAQDGPISFQVLSGGSYAVLSPITKLALLHGQLADGLQTPVSGALIVSGNPTLLSAVTDSTGSFTIPAGPPGTYGLLGAQFGSSAGLLGLPLPPALPPGGIIDLVNDMVLTHLDLEGPPFPACPPGPPGTLLMRERQPINGTFALAQDETVHTFVQTSEAGLYGGAIVEPSAIESAVSGFSNAVLSLAFLGSLTVYESVRFSISDPTIARFKPSLTPDGSISETGTLVGVQPVSPGNADPMETATVTTVEIGLGGFGLLFPCSRTIQTSPRPVTVFGIVTAALPDGTVGQPYSASLVASGGSPPYTWSLTGVPGVRGLTISSAGVISGVPLDAGTNTVNVSVTDNNGLTVNRSFTIAVTGASLKVAVTPQSNGFLALTFAGSGFQPGEFVNITTSPSLPFSGPIVGGAGTSGAQAGSFIVTIAIPADTPPGPYIMRAAGLSSGLTQETSFTIIATGCGLSGEPSCGAASPLQQ